MKNGRTSGKKFCWKEGRYTQPQASSFCAKISGRLPVIHTATDNEDVGITAGLVNEYFQNLHITATLQKSINLCSVILCTKLQLPYLQY